MKKKLLALFLLVLAGFIIYGQEIPGNDNLDFAQVVYAEAVRDPGGTWTFNVTVRHDDTGWRHYANMWVIVDPYTGEEMGQRILTHPHVDEQPFTRSMVGVFIPEGITQIEVRARCNLHGYSGQAYLVTLEE
jgi:hypothetical protein